MTEAVIRIGIDLTPILPGSENGGAKFATLQFIESLLSDFADRIHLTLFIPEIVHDELSARFADRADLACTRRGTDRTNVLREAIEELRSQSRIRAVCRQSSIRLFYSPFGRFVPVPLEMPFVAQVHDLVHVDYPDTLTKRDRLWRHLNLLKLSLRRAVFQVSSDFTGQRLHAAYSIPLERIHRTYLPIHGRLLADGVSNQETYFFYPARAWPHKNHEKLLYAYKAYREKLADRAWNLVLTAGNDQRVDRLKSLAGQLGLETHVKFLGEIEERQLGRIYQGAAALIFPSRYEGFGIPLIEAMYFGVPIICGRGGSQPEVAGDAAIYVDVENPEDIAGVMVRLTEDRIVGQQLVNNGKRQLQKFILKTEIEKLVRVFEKCAAAELWGIQGLQRRLAIFFFGLLYALSPIYLPASELFSSSTRRRT
jgi:glycosyltransferase involved in cell wall biosynthesis